MKLKTQIVRHWIAISITSLTLMMGIFSLIRAVGTTGKNFSGFFFGPNLLVSVAQRASWPGIERGLKSLDRILSVDGVEMTVGDRLLEKVAHGRPGDTLIYRIKSKNGEIRTVGIPITTYTFNDFLIGFLAPFLMGLLFLFFGVILYFSQPEFRGSLLYLALSCVIASFCMTVYEAYTTFTFFRVTLVYPMIGAISAHLFAKFPTRRISRPRVKAVVGFTYVFATLLLIWRQMALYSAGDSAILSKLSSLFVLLVLTVDGLLLIRAYQQSGNQASRDRIKVIGIGLMIASSVVALWSLNFLLISESFYLDEGVLLASVFPLFMTYAILRKNVFELDRLIRLTLSYGVAGSTVLVLYVAVFAAVKLLTPVWASGPFNGILLVALAGLGAVLFNSLRRRVNHWVHRILFKSHYDLSTALEALDRSLTPGMSRVEIAEKVGANITQFFSLDRAALICPANSVNDHPLLRFYRWPSPPDIEKWLTLFESEGFGKFLTVRATPVDVLEMMEDSPDRFRQSLTALRANQIEVVLPLVSSNKLLGILLLGRKGSKDDFDRVDFRLLMPIAARVAILLENADLGLTIEQQARLAALGKMSSIMIHDIKNPLSTIRTAAGSLKRRFNPSDQGHELVTIIEEEVDRMNQTIAEILTYAKPAGLSLSETYPNELVSDIVHRLKPSFEKDGIRLEMELAEENPPLRIDSSLVRRAIENLLMNAKEATPDGGLVRIRLSLSGQGNGHAKLLIYIEDTGHGMEPAIRERVFQPFYTTKSSGTGLGLALVKQIVSQHGGEVELETKPGAGTRFTLHFPLDRAK